MTSTPKTVPVAAAITSLRRHARRQIDPAMLVTEDVVRIIRSVAARAGRKRKRK